jgi:hypothetical protein
MYPPLSTVLYVIKDGEFIKTGKSRYMLSHQKVFAKPNEKNNTPKAVKLMDITDKIKTL